MRSILFLTTIVLVGSELQAQIIPALGVGKSRPASGQQFSGGAAVQRGNGATVFRSRPTQQYQQFVPGGNAARAYPYPAYGQYSYGYNPYRYPTGNIQYLPNPVQPQRPVTPPGGNLDPRVNQFNPQVNQPQTGGFSPSNSLSLQDAQVFYQQRRQQEALRQKQIAAYEKRRQEYEQRRDDGQQQQQDQSNEQSRKAKQFYQHLYGHRRSTFNQSQQNYYRQGQSQANQSQYGYSQYGQKYVSPYFHNGSVHNQSVYNQSQSNYTLHNVLQPGSANWRY